MLGSFKNIEGVVKKTKHMRLRAHLFDAAALTALTYASETWTLRKQDEHALSLTQLAVEKTVPGIPLYTQVQSGIHSFELRRKRRGYRCSRKEVENQMCRTRHAYGDDRWTREVAD
ncbi:unnamed protein product [Haemonchus placei]|uniref:Transposase n=1 Tax=Haemonchus placei TaxID=6290 RepID=A0A0N4WE94_HAEPC|nr:unnamed protein product [Haemonchus placei]